MSIRRALISRASLQFGVALCILLLSQALPTTSIPLFPEVQINFIFIFLVGVHFFLPMLQASTVTLTIGVLTDLISNGYFGFYLLAFYASLIPVSLLTFVLKNVPLPLFMITVLSCSMLKGIIEVVFIFVFIKVGAFHYFNHNVLPEAILNATFCPLVFLFFKARWTAILKKLFKKRGVKKPKRRIASSG